MPKQRQDPVIDGNGDERHPAFGIARVGRILATPGEVLFQSDLRHREFIRITVSEAIRNRDLHQDWVHPKRVLFQLAMSMSQWASLIAAGGEAGVPVTIDYDHGDVPGLNPAPRLAVTTAETREAATAAFEDIRSAWGAYQDGLAGRAGAAERRRLAANVQAAIDNAPANVEFAAKKLTEHAEEVVERSRADIEAMVIAAPAGDTALHATFGMLPGAEEE